MLESDEHALVFDEAKNMGYKLPDKDLFIAELETYRNYLDTFDELTGTIDRKGFVKIPAKTAHDIHELMKYNCFMIARVFDDVFNTQYMDHFGFYKQAGYPYKGPNALQPCVNLLASMTRTIREIDRQISNGRQYAEWPQLICDPSANTYHL